ncbi:MAG: phage tail protein [Sphingomonas sp.]|uniref:phage tail protein n=1 Tax=Sphingomonas sp. TaxID=28214 RepID=UPI00122556FD|nr:tail fiber protein [Sphingomonas sp.]THD34764.1 MAG: phage tail protein [Sphingomonas sp.]
MSEPFLGEIRIFPYNFAPRGWATCSGQILSIAQNTALFSLLGTTYGGNGQTTFALPDLRGRAPIGQGQGPGLSPYTLGQIGGTETTTLLTTNMPIHTHAATLNATTTKATSQVAAAGSQLAKSVDAGGTAVPEIYVPSGTGGTQVALGGLTVGTAGGSQPFSLLNPYLVLEPCIALEGIFPSRN